MKQTVWNPPSTAPRDGITMILADIGWPWAVPAVWNAYDKNWAYVTIQISPMVGGPDDTYLEAEWADDKELRQWAAIPKITRKPT